MSKFQTALCSVVLFIYGCPMLWAQQCSDNCCSSQLGGQAPAGVMFASSHQKGEWMASYRFMNMNMSGNLNGSTSISDNEVFKNYIMCPNRMQMQMHMLMLMFGVSDKLTVMGMINYNSQSMGMNMFPSAACTMPGMSSGSCVGNMDGTTSGLSDTKLYAIYKLIDQKSRSVLLTSGIGIPTGNINTTDLSSLNASQISSYNMQLGSGSVEFLPALTYLKSFGQFCYGAQASSTIRLNKNASHYRLGNEVNLTSWLSYKWFNWLSNSFRVEHNVIGSLHGYDNRIYASNEPGSNPLNSGGQQLNLYAGTNFYVSKGVFKRNKFLLEYGIPAYQQYNGIQMQRRANLYAGWQYAF